MRCLAARKRMCCLSFGEATPKRIGCCTAQMQENKCFQHWNVDFHSIYHRCRLDVMAITPACS